jgi:polyhydroxybutyrate depolymerase
MKNILIISLLTLFISCSNDEFEKDGYDKDGNSYDGPIETITHNGLERKYIIYTPQGYDGNSKLPLLLNFHGFGGQAGDYMSYSNMRSTADSENFILVYPQGTDLDGSPHWNAALNGGDNKSNVDDLGFIEALINKLSSENLIDLKRVYAVGYSNGGMMSYALACYKSGLISAIGSVSGYMLQTECSPSHSIPLIKLHGTTDYYDGGGVYNSVESVLNFWVNFNNTDTNPIISNINDNGTSITSYKYENGDNSVSVEHYKIIGGEHVWFNNDFDGKNTGQLIWDFVSKYDIDGLRN